MNVWGLFVKYQVFEFFSLKCCIVGDIKLGKMVLVYCL